MTKVEIELSTLRRWFNKLEMHEEEDVTEEIFDAIKAYEKEIQDGEYNRVKQKEAVMAAVEPSLLMNQIVINDNYRIKKQPNFKQSFMVLAGAEVQAVKKGRTKVTVLIVEPGNSYTGKTLTTDITSLTNL